MDCVYQWHWQYQWVAAIANRVLKPEGHLLAWYGGNKDHIVQNLMDKSMQKVWTLHYSVPAKTTGNMGAFKLRCWTSFLFWYRKKGSKSVPNKTIIDTYISTMHPSGSFKWQKNYGVLAYYLCAFTKEGDFVLDTMAGEGSVGVVAKIHHRNFLGMEIDEKRAKRAQERIDSTQEMALLIEPTQPETLWERGQHDSIENSDQEAGAPESARIAEEKSP